MSDAINKFFDKVEGVLDATIPRGRLGIVTLTTTDVNDKPMMVRHFGRYKMGLVCEPEREFANADFAEKPPRGGWCPFCLRCIRLTLEELKDG